ncbi:MAG: ATP-binding protein [Sphingomonadales bacterium]
MSVDSRIDSERPFGGRSLSDLLPRFIIIALLFAAVSLTTAAVSIALLYRTAIEETRARLVETAKSQARMIEAIARFGNERTADNFGDETAAQTLRQFREAHGNYSAPGRTSEIVLGTLKHNNMIRLLRNHQGKVGWQVPIPMQSMLAEPMRQALTGHSGTIDGPDYRGEPVLAAFEPVKFFNWGLVVKMDLAEVRAPFVKVVIWAVAICILLILVGTTVFFRLARPIARQLKDSEERRLTELQKHNSVLIDEIKQRKAVERNLKETGQRLKDFASSSADWFWELDLNLQPTYMSPGTHDLLAAPSDDDHSSLPREAISPRSNPEAFRQFQEFFDAREPFRDFKFDVTHEGVRRWFRSGGRPFFDASNKFMGYRGCATDVTMAEETKEKLARLAVLPKLNPNPVIELDAEGRVTYLNDKARRVFPGVSITGFDHPALSGVVSIIAEIKDSGKDLVVRELAINDSIFQQRICQTPSGRRFYVFSNDITALKDAERKRNELEQELVQAQKMEALGTLAGGIAHEINTPVQYVGDNVRFLRDAFVDINKVLEANDRLVEAVSGRAGLEDEVAATRNAASAAEINFLKSDIPEAIEQSLEGVERVSTIVKAIKEFSHPGAAEKLPIDINRAIETTITVTRNQWKYFADMRTDFDKSLSHVPCLPNEFNQVILNLIVNAAQALEATGRDEKGEIVISTVKEPEWAVIKVHDNGTGIPKAIAGKVFDPFFTTKEPGKGTGQGLALSHRIITRKHGGTLSFETEEGAGTTFIIRLPLANPNEEETANQ